MKLLSKAKEAHVTIGSRKLKIKGELGEGGFAVIRLVKDVKAGDKFALKTMHCQTPEQLAIARKEVAAFRAFNGTHGLLSLVDAEEHGTDVLLLLPWAVAGDAQQMIDKARDSGEWIAGSRVSSVFVDVCRGVRALHACGLAHRDIKPSNVLLLDSQCVIADFGSVALAETGEVHDSIAAKRLADEIEQQSTPLFRAPEQFAIGVHGRLTAKTDVWALGCMLFALLFNETPFEGALREQGSVELAIQNGTYQLPTERPLDDIPPELLKVMSKMLILHPTDRPTVAAIVKELSAGASEVEVQPRTLKLVQETLVPLLTKATSPSVAATSSTAAARAALFGDDAAPAPVAAAVAAPAAAPTVEKRVGLSGDALPATAAARVAKGDRRRPASANSVSALVSQDSFNALQLSPPPSGGGSARNVMARRHGRSNPPAISDADGPSSSSSSSSPRSASPDVAPAAAPAPAPVPAPVTVKLDKARLVEELRKWREAFPAVDADVWQGLCVALQAAELK